LRARRPHLQVPELDADALTRSALADGWKTDAGDIRHDAGVAREILEFIEEQ
jgi:hypothetical protein